MAAKMAARALPVCASGSNHVHPESTARSGNSSCEGGGEGGRRAETPRAAWNGKKQVEVLTVEVKPSRVESDQPREERRIVATDRIRHLIAVKEAASTPACAWVSMYARSSPVACSCLATSRHAVTEG